jgi:hypothetical protein
VEEAARDAAAGVVALPEAGHAEVAPRAPPDGAAAVEVLRDAAGVAAERRAEAAVAAEPRAWAVAARVARRAGPGAAAQPSAVAWAFLLLPWPGP